MRLRACPQCAQSIAAAAALGIAAVPMGCNHEWGSHDHLPDIEIHAATTAPTVVAITTTANMSGVSITATPGCRQPHGRARLAAAARGTQPLTVPPA